MLGNDQIINYEYSMELIKEIDDKNKSIKNNIIAKIIMSKICIDLIEKFEETSNYNDDYEDELVILKEDNEGFISDNLKALEEFGLNIDKEEYMDKILDKFYSDLIKGLIKNKKFDSYEIVLNLMKDIDVENIPITKTMYEELSDILNKEEIIKGYKINTKEDFYIESKINFYYILLKYIFKNQLYIYNINLFLDTRKLIIKLLRANEVINKGKNIPFNDKITYVIKKLADSDYYFLKVQKLELVLEYYKEIFFESKKDAIILIEDILNNNKKFEDKFLTDYEKAKTILKELPVIKYILLKKYKNNNTENEIKKAVDTWEILKDLINKQKIKKMKDNERRIIFHYFEDEKNKSILHEIFGKETYDTFSDNIKKFFEDKNSLEQNNKKIESVDKIEDSNKENNSCQKEKNNTKVDFPSLNNSDMSTFYESRDQGPAEPIGLLKQLNGDISSIKNLVLSKCSFALHTNNKDEKPFIEYENIIYLGKNDLKIQYSLLMDYKRKLFSDYKNSDEHIDFKKFFEFLEDIEKRITEEFKNEFRIELIIELIKEEKNEKDKICNITAFYNFREPLEKSNLRYKEENVLVNKTDSKLQGFNFMLCDMNSQKYKNIKYQKDFLSQNIYRDKRIGKNGNNYFALNESIYKKIADEYSIIEYIKTLGKTTYSADFIKELSNGYYIIGSQNILTIYDHQFTKKFSKECKDWVYSVCERVLINEKNNYNNKLQIICCMNSNIGLLEIENNQCNFKVIETEIKQKTRKKSKEKYEKTKNTYNTCIEMRENNYIMGGLRGVVYYKNFFGNDNEILHIKITDKAYKSGIKLNENIVALTSNSVVPEGTDKLIFYNVRSSNLTEGLEGYSFIISEHNMSLIPRIESKSENKILLCACKKYIEGQKNGILLVNPQLGNNKVIKNPFYETDFEVFCFCPILIVKNNNKIIGVDYIDKEYKNNIEIEDTKFFFVSAFDDKKREGIIKLYKIIIPDKIENTKIKFLQNIEIDNKGDFKGFEGQIKSIIQSRITGNIIVTCANGKIYLFTQPNLSLYLNRYK